MITSISSNTLRLKSRTILAFLIVFLTVSGFSCRRKPPADSDANTPEPNTAAETKPVTMPVEPAAPVETATTQPDSVAVTVDGAAITEGQIEARIKPQLEKMAQNAKLPPTFVQNYKKQIRQLALERMIVEQLLDQKVEAAGIVVTEEEVTDRIKQIASQQQPALSLEQFKAIVEAYGASFDQVKQQLRKELAYNKIMQAQFAGRINITEDDARKYYDENRAKFRMPEQVRASHILIKPNTTGPGVDPNEAKAQARAKAEDLLKQIQSGTDFATLAKAFSDCPSGAKGGDLGFGQKGTWVAPFEKAAFALNVGQVSDIVETQFGYHIIKVTDHKDSDVRTFEQAKDDIIKMLTQKKQAELMKEYIDSLKAEANIVYPPGKEPAPASGFREAQPASEQPSDN